MAKDWDKILGVPSSVSKIKSPSVSAKKDKDWDKILEPYKQDNEIMVTPSTTFMDKIRSWLSPDKTEVAEKVFGVSREALQQQQSPLTQEPINKITPNKIQTPVSRVSTMKTAVQQDSTSSKDYTWLKPDPVEVSKKLLGTDYTSIGTTGISPINDESNISLKDKISTFLSTAENVKPLSTPKEVYHYKSKQQIYPSKAILDRPFEPVKLTIVAEGKNNYYYRDLSGGLRPVKKDDVLENKPNDIDIAKMIQDYQDLAQKQNEDMTLPGKFVSRVGQTAANIQLGGIQPDTTGRKTLDTIADIVGGVAGIAGPNPMIPGGSISKLSGETGKMVEMLGSKVLPKTMSVAAKNVALGAMQKGSSFASMGAYSSLANKETGKEAIKKILARGVIGVVAGGLQGLVPDTLTDKLNESIVGRSIVRGLPSSITYGAYGAIDVTNKNAELNKIIKEIEEKVNKGSISRQDADILIDDYKSEKYDIPSTFLHILGQAVTGYLVENVLHAIEKSPKYADKIIKGVKLKYDVFKARNERDIVPYSVTVYRTDSFDPKSQGYVEATERPGIWVKYDPDTERMVDQYYEIVTVQKADGTYEHVPWYSVPKGAKQTVVGVDGNIPTTRTERVPTEPISKGEAAVMGTKAHEVVSSDVIEFQPASTGAKGVVPDVSGVIHIEPSPKGKEGYKGSPIELEPIKPEKTNIDIVKQDGSSVTTDTPKEVVGPEASELKGIEPAHEEKIIPKSIIKAAGKQDIAKDNSGKSIGFVYEVVDAKDLVTSHTIHMNNNPEYPENLQPRDRTRTASELQINKIVDNLQPEFLGENPRISDGAPIVGDDYVVESGNGRVIALQKIYEANHKNKDKYRTWLVKNADKFGININDIPDKPILVRRRTTDVNRQEFVKAANEPAIATMSSSETAKSDAEKLNQEILDLFLLSETGVINSSANRKFITEFVGNIIPDNEQNKYVTADGLLSQEGLNRVKNAIFYKAYENATLMSRLSETLDNNVKTVTNALLTIAPKVVKIKEGIENGTIHSVDFSKDISEATNIFSNLKNTGEDIELYLQQKSIFDDDNTGIIKSLIAILNANNRSAKKLTEFFDSLLNDIIKLGDPNQISVFGEVTTKNKADVLEAAIRRYNLEKEESKQVTFFEIPGERSSTDIKDTSGIRQKGEGQKDLEDSQNKIEIKPIAYKDTKVLAPNEIIDELRSKDITYELEAESKLNKINEQIDRALKIGELGNINLYRRKQKVLIGELIEELKEKLNTRELPSSVVKSIHNKHNTTVADKRKKIETSKYFKGFKKEIEDNPSKANDIVEQYYWMALEDDGINLTNEMDEVVNKYYVSHDKAIRKAIAELEKTLKEDPQKARPAKSGINIKQILERGVSENEGTGDTTKLSDIEAFVSEFFDIPIKQGKFRERALGIFKVRPEIIRLKSTKDMDTLFHEMGHFLDKKYGLASDAFRSELLTLGKVTSRGYYSNKEVMQEGVAEFFRYYMLDKNKAKEIAPDFYHYIERTLGSSKELRDFFETVRTGIDNYRKQSPEERILSNLSIGGKTVGRKITPDSIYTMFFDELHPLYKAVKTITGGEKIEVSSDPYMLARLYAGVGGKVEAILNYGMVDGEYNKITKSFKDILEPVKDNLNSFRAYAVSKRAMELLNRGIDQGILREDAEKVIKNVSPENVLAFDAALKELYDFQDKVLQTLVDSGILSAKAKAAMNNLNKNYIPFYKVVIGTQGGLGKGYETHIPVKNIKSSKKDIIDPIESIIKNTFLYISIADKNRIGQALVDLADAYEGSGKILDKVPPRMIGKSFSLSEIIDTLRDAGFDPDSVKSDVDLDAIATIFRPMGYTKKDTVITVFKHGKPQYYEIHDIDLYRAFAALDNETTLKFVEFLSYPAKLLRAGATINPEFATRNPWKDAFTAAIVSEYGFIPGLDTVKGLMHVLKQDEVYQQWLYSGGAGAAMVSVDRNTMKRQLDKLLTDKSKYNILLHPIELLRALSEFTEEATRVRIFERGLEKEGDSREALLKSAFASREGTVDFGRFGTATRQYNKVTAFFNAGLQGVDTIARRFKRHPLETLLKSLFWITLPSIILWPINKNDPRYRELPQWQRDYFWIIPTKKRLYRIPKPFEIGIIFGSSVERILDSIYEYSSGAFDDFWILLKDVLVPELIPTAFLPLGEALTNYSFFKNLPIVPKSEQTLLPADQYGNYTSETAKLVGRMFNTSPRLTEHILKGYGGGLAQYALDISDMALKGVGVIEPTTKPTRDWQTKVPGLKGFALEPYQGQSSSINELYKELNGLQARKNSAKVNKKAFPGKDASRLKQLQSAASKLSDLRKTYDRIYNNDKMTAIEKKDLLDKNQMRQINIARSVLGKSRID